MKKLFLITAILLISLINYAQVSAPKGIKVGKGATLKTLSVAELSTLDGIGIDSTIEERLDAKPNIADGVLTYNKVQVDALLEDKADTVGQAFTGVNTFPTAAVGTNTTQAATTAFVNTTVKEGSVHRIYTNNAQIENTGDTNLNTVLTVTGGIPANSIGVNGNLRIVAYITSSSGTNTRAAYVFIGTTQVGKVSQTTTSNTIRVEWIIYNRGSLTSQVMGDNASTSGGGWVAGTAAFDTATIDFGVANDIVIKMQCETSGSDYVRMEAFEVIASY